MDTEGAQLSPKLSQMKQAELELQRDCEEMWVHINQVRTMSFLFCRKEYISIMILYQNQVHTPQTFWDMNICAFGFSGSDLLKIPIPVCLEQAAENAYFFARECLIVKNFIDVIKDI